jgi:hypothetical protein
MICRGCADLRYASQSEEEQWRADRKADAIRRRLGATDRGRHEFPPKPRKMRRVTYQNLWKRHNDLLEAWSHGMNAALGELEKRAAASFQHLHKASPRVSEIEYARPAGKQRHL